LYVSRTNEEIVQSLLPKWCDENDIEYDADSLTGVWSGRHGSIEYEWNVEISSDKEHRVIEENKFISLIPLLATNIVHLIFPFGLFVIFIAQNFRFLEIIYDNFGSRGLSMLDSIIQGSGFLLIILFILSTFIVLDLARVSSPLIDGQEEGDKFKTYTDSNYDGYVFAVEILMIIAAVLIYNTYVTFAILIASILVVFAIIKVRIFDDGELIMKLQKEYQTPLDMISQKDTSFSNIVDINENIDIQLLEVPQKLFVSVFVIAAVFLLISGANQTIEFIVQNTEYINSVDLSFTDTVWYNLVDIIGAVILIVAIPYKLQELGDNWLKVPYYGFYREGLDKYSKIINICLVIMTSALLYFSLFFVIDLVFEVESISLYESTLGFDYIIIASALFISYFYIGIFFQIVSNLFQTYTLLSNSTDQKVSFGDYEADYRLLKTDELYACSFSMLGYDYIIISQGIKSSLDEAPFAALIAHEEAHIRHNDTKLCNLISIGSVLLLVGKNALYSLVNFQSRENAADDYAKAVVGEDAIIQALSKIKDKADGEIEYESFGNNFTPNFKPSQSRSIFRIFTLYYGAFTMSNSHLSFDDRIDRLDSSSSNADSPR